MNLTERVVVMDEGNTSLKVGIFDGGRCISTQRFGSLSPENTMQVFKEIGDVPVVVASVRKKTLTEADVKPFTYVYVIDASVKWPFEMDYETPQTLGIDRMCNISGAMASEQLPPLAVIDIGTCITLDVLTKENTYVGGSIFPGIDLRYKAMHQFTGQLPLLKKVERPALIGKSTSSCMHTGVMNGLQFELNGLMDACSQQYPGLTFFVTGGDAQRFDFGGKYNIFVDENLTLNGIFRVFNLNRGSENN
jgi:type III pantothenate kinase